MHPEPRLVQGSPGHHQGRGIAPERDGQAAEASPARAVGVSPAILSLIALLVAIALSMASKLNVGVLAMAFAWLIGTYVADWRVEQEIGRASCGVGGGVEGMDAGVKDNT